MSRLKTCAAVVLLTGALALGPGAASPARALHVPLRTQAGIPIVWKKFPVVYSINEKGSDNVQDGGDETAIRLAMAQWNELPGTSVKLVENTKAAARKISDWKPLGSHIVVFAEEGDPAILPPGSGIIAVTPIAYSVSTGGILDADIVFNGAEFVFTTSPMPGAMDIWSVTSHEAGHFLGLDHSGIVGSTMWPFEAVNAFASRSLSDDDRAGLRALYPKGAVKGSIEGVVRRSGNGAAVSGANVWARRVADGRVATGALTDALGRYAIRDLDPGTYRVVAAPLDGGMTANNLSTFNKSLVQSDFSPGQTGPLTVTGSSVLTAPDLLVGPNVSINITQPSTGLTLQPGQRRGLNLGGVGLAGAVASVPDSSGAFVITGSVPTITITASLTTPPGLYDLVVTNGQGEVADWNGGIEVLPPTPEVWTVNPSVAGTAGGSTVILTGFGFYGSPQVLFGGAPAASVSVIAPDRIAAVVPKHASGGVTVTLVSESGEPAVYGGAFYFVDGVNPGVTSVFPSTASAAGGAEVTVLGSGFVPGATVHFGNTPATSTVVVSGTEVRAQAPALAVGLYDVFVVNPGAFGLVGTAVNAFAAVAESDPAISSADPAEVPSSGGAMVTLSGNDFAPGMQLRLFATPKTSTGGLVAAATFVNQQSLTFVAPPNVKGNKSFVGDAAMILSKANGQAALASGILEYVPSMSRTGMLTGAIDPPGDVDRIFVDTVAGATVSLRVAALGKSSLTPAILLRDPAGLVAGSAGTSGAKIANLTVGPLPATGRYAFEVSGLDGTQGAYRATFRETLPKAVTTAAIPAKTPAAVGPDEAVLAFDAKAGSTLRGTLTAKGGLLAAVAAFDGPSGSLLTNPAVTSRIAVVKGGQAIRFNNVPLSELGAYTVKIGASAGTSGTLSGTLTVVPGKAPTSFVEQ